MLIRKVRHELLAGPMSLGREEAREEGRNPSEIVRR